jgi:hypothetical protein
MTSKSFHWSCLAQDRIGITPEGETVPTMISDDSFSMIQPTLPRPFWIASLRSR